MQQQRCQQLITMFTPRISQSIQAISQDAWDGLCEIRMRTDKPLSLTLRRKNAFLDEFGNIVDDPRGALIVSQKELENTLEILSSHSIYAHEEELKKGYLTILGGFRIGVAGKTIAENGTVEKMTSCSSICIRIAREYKGCADQILQFIENREGVHSVLILSAPMLGKTTLLRDIARQLSDGVFGINGKRVVVIDERCELAASLSGVPQLDIGMRTDVLDACPKACGMMMALRSLSPQVLITDEIGGREDSLAIQNARYCGVSVIATAHANGFHEALQREDLSELFRNKTFSRVIELSGTPGHISRVLDDNGDCLYEDCPWKH